MCEGAGWRLGEASNCALSEGVEEPNAFLSSEKPSRCRRVLESILTLCEKLCGSTEMASEPFPRKRLFPLCVHS